MQSIEGYNFKGFGTHCENYPTPYLTVAAGIGMKKEEVDVLISRLSKVLKQMHNHKQKLEPVMQQW